MWKVVRVFCLVASMTLLAEVHARGDDALLTRIAFGSCAKQDKPQPIWDAVVEMQPQLFVLLGDNIYGDTADMDVLRAKYSLLGNQSGYRKLKQTCPVVATWDDHDYGADDSGANYPKKRESQQIFLDFFEAPPDDPRRSHEGVYSASVFGPVGKQVQLILLDTRYFRSPLKTGYKPGEPGEGYPLFDITSSSLNAPSGNMTKAGIRFANQINSHRIGLQFFDTNFGTILIDWDQPDPVVRQQVRDEKGDVVLQHRVSLSQLRRQL